MALPDGNLTISPDTWQWLQDKAKENLENLKEDDEFAANRAVEHWKSIVTGNVPFGFVISEE